MFKNYIKFAWRHLRKGLSYSVINISGLALGIASVLLIFLYAQHELSFDSYHKNKDRIYRLVSYQGFNEKSWAWFVPGDLVSAMRASYPEVEDVVNMINCSGGPVEVNKKQYTGLDVFCSESNVFNIFSFPLIAGNKERVLDAPYTTVISESTAHKLFGDTNPVGKTIAFNWDNSKKDFEVTGVMKDIPANSHFRYDAFLSYSSLKGSRRCLTCGKLMYALLKSNADTAAISKQLYHQIHDIDGKDYVDKVRLQPLKDIYFGSIPAQKKGNWQYIQILTAIAVVILLIGCGNYMNLATARYSRRSKEIGIRKVLGAYRLQLARQFILETLLLALAALPVSILLLKLAIPWFNIYAGTEISLAIGANYWFYLAIAGILFFTGLIAGSYPALYLSSFRPREVLKGTPRTGPGSDYIRKGLVTFQFLAAMTMIAVTLLIIQQLQYVQQKNLGFDSDKIVTIRVGEPGLLTQGPAIKESFSKMASVKAVTASPAPAGHRFTGIRFTFKPDSASGEKLTVVTPRIDADFLKTMDIKLLAGRNVRPSLGKELKYPTEALINETAAKALGYSDYSKSLNKVVAGRFRIVGVVQDFYMESLQQEIKPAIMSRSPFNTTHVYNVRLAGGSIRQGLDDLQTAWKNTGATGSLDYTFLDDLLQQQYKNEQQASQVIGMFAVLSIIIACMGLFGLASFTTQQRMKEIGIRKVLGAGVGNIIMLLYKDFGKLILLSAVLSAPLIYYISKQWLQNFAYHIQISPYIFIAAATAVILITVLATGARSLQAALLNPVDSIRQE